MRGVVLKPLPWSGDGITVELLSVGDDRDFGRHFGGLRDVGYVRAPEVQAFQGAPETKADPQDGVGNEPASAEDSGAPLLSSEQGSPASGGDGNTETGTGAAASGGGIRVELAIRHVGRGKWAVYRGDERLTEDALTKDEAAARLVELQG